MIPIFPFHFTHAMVKTQAIDPMPQFSRSPENKNDRVTDVTDSLINPLRLRAYTRIGITRKTRHIRHSHYSDSPMNATIIALDLGTQTGWALRGPEGRVDSGSQSFRPQRFEGGGMRYLRFKHWLTELKQTADPIHAVYFEEVRRHAGVDAAHAYGGFLAHLTAWCEHHQIPYQGVPVGTIKRHATGKGNADKLAVVNAMRARGYAPADDNEADALALLTWAIETGRG